MVRAIAVAGMAASVILTAAVLAEPEASSHAVSAHHRRLDECVTLRLTDSYGDGWNGAYWTWTEDSTGASTSGTLSSGSSGTAALCGNDCYTVAVGSGSYPSEVSWTVVNDETGATEGSGGAGDSAAVCFAAVPSPQPTTSPVPTATSMPTSAQLFSFETDFDGWTTSTFLRQTGSTPTNNTGPSSAYDGSYYVFAETDSPNCPGVEFSMERNFGEDVGSVSFHYHMYSDFINTTVGTAVLKGSDLTNYPPDGCTCTATTRTDGYEMPDECSTSPTSGSSICYILAENSCTAATASSLSSFDFVYCAAAYTTLWSKSGNQGDTWHGADVSIASGYPQLLK